MAPKGKRIKGKAIPVPLGECHDPANLGHVSRLKEAIASLEHHPLLSGIKEAGPITRGETDGVTGKAGYKDTFTQAQLESDLKNAGISEQAGNLFWQDSFLVPIAGIPMNTQAMTMMMQRNFKDPCPFPDKLVVAVSGVDYDAAGRLGAWQHITPEEILHAYIFAVARDAKQPGNHARVKAWRYHLLTVTFSFVIASGEDIYWKQARMREDTDVLYQVVTRTALQRIYEINMVLAQRQDRAISYSALADLYQKHLQQTSSQEKISSTFITEAVRLYKHLLCFHKAPTPQFAFNVSVPHHTFYIPTPLPAHSAGLPAPSMATSSGVQPPALVAGASHQPS